MNIKKKVTDFIRVEKGNIGKQAAIVTGALLASSVLGTVLTQQASAMPCCHEEHYDVPAHDNHIHYPHSNSHNNIELNCIWC
jgi:hypothetical protein